MGDLVDLFSEQWTQSGIETDEIWRLAIWGRVKRAGTLMDRLVAAAISPHGLQIGEFEVLAALRRSNAKGQLTPTELLQNLIVSPGTVTNRTDRLEAAGLVRRTPHPDDGRVVIVTLTAHGRRTFDRAFDEVRTALAQALEPLREMDADLTTCLKALISQLDGEESHRSAITAVSD